MSGTEIISIGAKSDDGHHTPIVSQMRESWLGDDVPGPERRVSSDETSVRRFKTQQTDDGELPLWVYAHIWSRHLVDKKTFWSFLAHDFTEAEMKVHCRGHDGYDRKDFVSQLVWPSVGGLSEEYNLFPQDFSWRTDSNRLRRQIKCLIKNWLKLSPGKCQPNVEYQMRLYYGDKEKPERPSKFKYSVGFFLGRVDHKLQARCQLNHSLFNGAVTLLEKSRAEKIEQF